MIVDRSASEFRDALELYQRRVQAPVSIKLHAPLEVCRCGLLRGHLIGGSCICAGPQIGGERQPERAQRHQQVPGPDAR